MNLWFSIKEGFKGFRRARLSTIITISSITISLFLIALFIIISLNVNSWVGNLRSKLELEVFIDRTLSSANAKKVYDKISGLEEIKKAEFISKEDAAQRFEKEFGKNIYDVLQTNPLPASVVLVLKDQYTSAQNIAKISSKINAFDGVDEVIYQKDLNSIIDKYRDILMIVGLIIIILLITITFILLYNTIRLTIYARRDIIEIMKLVGAKKTFIKRPFIIEGVLQGLIGAVLSLFLTYGSVLIIIRFIYPFLVFSYELMAVLIFMGMFIGYFSSRISVQKHLDAF